MFRTARGFLLVAPLAFVAALLAFLVAHPRVVEAFTPYPFLVDAIGRPLGRRPLGRFSATATVFFVVPYLVTGVLLALADLGVASSSRLWRGRATFGREPFPPEVRYAFAGAAVLLSVVGASLLNRLANGGELPGGVNVAPLFVAAVPFLALAASVPVAGVAAVPRALARRFESPAPSGGAGRPAGGNSGGEA